MPAPRPYETSDQVYAVFGELWRRLLADPALGAAHAKTPLRVALVVTDPPAQIVLSPGQVHLGEADQPPDVRIILDADTAHRFWLKQLTLPVALARGLMRVTGPTMHAMKLPGLLRPGFAQYPGLCRAHGIPVEVD